MKLSPNILSSRFIIAVIFSIGFFVLIGIGKLTIDQIPDLWPLMVPVIAYQTSETFVKVNKNGNGKGNTSD